MLTDAELQGIAAQALNMAKRDLELDRFNFLLASYHIGDRPPLHRMDRIEKLIIERLGEDWLNHGSAKDAGFRMLRLAVDLLPPDALVLVMMCNGFAPTAKFRALPEAQQKKLLDAAHERHHEAVEQGLLEVHDVLMAMVQTPERTCVCNQSLDRRGEFTGKPQFGCGPPEGFDGRFKMFGAPYVPPVKFAHEA